MPNLNINRRVVLSTNGLLPETIFWLSKLNTPPSTLIVNSVNTFIKQCKSDGNWQQLDRFWLFAQDIRANARKSIVNPTSADLTETVPPTWSSFFGYTGDALTQYLDLNFAPNGGTKYIQNSACFGVYSRTAAAAGTSVIIGANNVTDGTAFFPRFTGDILYGYCNNILSSSGQTNTNTTGMLSVLRNGATNFQSYRNGVSLGTETIASTAPIANNFYVLARNNNGAASGFSSLQVSLVFIGGNINQATFYTAVQALATSIGFNV